MSEIRRIGYTILAFIVCIIIMPATVLMSVAYLIVYVCLHALRHIVLAIGEYHNRKGLDELYDSASELFECWDDLVLDLKIES